MRRRPAATATTTTASTERAPGPGGIQPVRRGAPLGRRWDTAGPACGPGTQTYRHANVCYVYYKSHMLTNQLVELLRLATPANGTS